MNGGMLDVAIVGGGPGGLAAANAILKCRPSLKIKVFERSTLQQRGAFVLVQKDGQQALQAISPEVLKRVSNAQGDYKSFARYTHDGQLVIRSDKALKFWEEIGTVPFMVTWHDLQMSLADALPEGVVETRVSFDSYTETEEGVQVHFKHGRPPVMAKVLIGCDGNRSAVREACLHDGPPEYMGDAIWRGITQLPDWFECPDGPVTFAEAGSMHYFQAMGMAKRGMLCWVAFSPWPKERLGELASTSYIEDTKLRAERAEQVKARALEAYKDWPSKVLRLIELTDASRITEHGQYFRRPEQIKVWGKGRVTLLGDAAHLATPVTGPGTNQAFQDAVDLGRYIGELGPTPAALRRYEEARIPEVAPVHAKSVNMFLEFMQGVYDWRNEGEAWVEYLKVWRPKDALRCVEPSRA